MPKLNLQLAARTYVAMEAASPFSIDMQQYARQAEEEPDIGACGTVGCIGGWTVATHLGRFLPDVSLPDLHEPCWQLLGGNIDQQTGTLAEQLLGLDANERLELFNPAEIIRQYNVLESPEYEEDEDEAFDPGGCMWDEEPRRKLKDEVLNHFHCTIVEIMVRRGFDDASNVWDEAVEAARKERVQTAETPT